MPIASGCATIADNRKSNFHSHHSSQTFLCQKEAKNKMSLIILVTTQNFIFKYSIEYSLDH